MKTIVLTKEVRKAHGISMHQLVRLEELGKYGFDDDIINGLVKYEIMPQVYKINTSFYVLRADVLRIIHTFVKDALVLYQAVDVKKDLVVFCSENAVSMADLQKYTQEAVDSGITDPKEIDAYVLAHAPKTDLLAAAAGEEPTQA